MLIWCLRAAVLVRDHRSLAGKWRDQPQMRNAVLGPGPKSQQSTLATPDHRAVSKGRNILNVCPAFDIFIVQWNVQILQYNFHKSTHLGKCWHVLFLGFVSCLYSLARFPRPVHLHTALDTFPQSGKGSLWGDSSWTDTCPHRICTGAAWRP